MKTFRQNIIVITLAALIVTAFIIVLPMSITYARQTAMANGSWNPKPSYPDYAPSGMPDFDEKQGNWGPAQGVYTWCGPVAVANSLWWLDSEYESLAFSDPIQPPLISDHFGLVTSYNPAWDDHDPQNVDPFIRNLALLMDTDGLMTHDGHIGTRWIDLKNGISQYLLQQGASGLFEVHDIDFPDFNWISTETDRCQDVELFLEFWVWTGGSWMPFTGNPSFEAGHIVTCAGTDTTVNPGELLISDPWQDAFEARTTPIGREPVIHAYPHPTTVHNDAQYVSQDGYQVVQSLLPPPPGYLPGVCELQGYMQTMMWPPNYHAFIRAAVATSPIEQQQFQGYVKPSYPDYAPSGMPDFDEKQGNWGPAQGVYTWCVPVAVANSLWWLDSKYESLMYGSPVPPPTISDHFNLVTAYGQWDDHDAQNVDPFVRDLAFWLDTDGIRSGDMHVGTRWTDVQPGIQQYLVSQGVSATFEVHSSEFTDFEWVRNETELCQDVELFLEFAQWTGGGWNPITDPSFESGHCVTSAGVDSATNQVLISDPWQDAFELGLVPGRSPVPHTVHGTSAHNDARYVSQDAYVMTQFVGLPPPGYPLGAWELQGYLQTMGYDPSYHAFVRGAVATSPNAAAVHDVAVIEVKTSKDGCPPKPVVSEGKTCRVNVTVENHGDYSETFNVTAFASDLTNTFTIDTASVTLAPGANTTVAFVWDTTGCPRTAYSIWSQADTVTGETHTTDNTLTGSTLKVTYPGDINDDGVIDIIDIVKVAGAFGSKLGDQAYNPNADLNDDEVIDIVDIVIVAGRFGESAP